MENAADALKIAFGVFIFIIAVSLSISTFSNARTAIDNIITYRDKKNSYIEVQKANTKNRIVGVETIVPTIYNISKENYKIIFLNKNEKPLVLYTKTDHNVRTEINYIDLGEKNCMNIIEILLKGESISKLNDISLTYTSNNNILNQYENLYNFFKNNQFEERIGELYQEDEDAGHEISSVLEINKTKKRVITYVQQ